MVGEQSGEKVTRLDELQDIDELQVVEVSAGQTVLHLMLPGGLALHTCQVYLLY